MNQHFLMILWCSFSFYCSFSQTALVRNSFAGTINGTILDSATQATLNKVTVMVQDVNNSLYKKQTVTNDDGYFELSGLPERQYQIMLTSIGYKTKIVMTPRFTSSTISIKTALVSVTEYLEAVQVNAAKQLIEQQADKIIYNVDDDPESKTANALDILQKIPLLTIGPDENLLMNGSNSYQVLINGKPSAIFLRNPGDVFKSMPASMIKTVEVITIPSSRYAAMGVGGIINIITYKKSIGGYIGGVNVRVSDPKGYAVGSNISATLGKLALAGNYSFNASANPASSSTIYRHDKLQDSRLEQTGTGSNKNNSQIGGGEVTWMMNSQNLLTVSYSKNNISEKSNSLQQSILLNAVSDVSEAYQNINNGKNNSRGNDFVCDYQRSSKKNDNQQLLLSCRYSNSLSYSNNDFVLQPLINYNSRTSVSNNKDAYREYSFQTDYVQPIKKHSLEMGASAISRHTNSDYFYMDRDPAFDVLVLDSSQSNNFNYKEAIYAGYLSLNLRMGKWGLNTGGRLELAKADAHFISSGTTAIQQYLNLIPTIILFRQLKGISTIKLAYSQRLQRPDLYNLNPYINLTDPRNISYGNPGLQPALAHVFELTFNALVKRFSINISVFNQFVNNSIQPFTTLSADTIARTTYGNVGKSHNSGLSVSSNITLFKKLSINMNSAFNYMQYSSTIDGKYKTSEGLTWHAAGLLNLRLKNWRISGNINYHAPNILVQGRSAGFISNSVTVNRYFLNKISIGLLANNPFHKYRHSFNEINDPAFYQVRETFNVLRRFNLSLNYRFSKVQSNDSTKTL